MTVTDGCDVPLRRPSCDTPLQEGAVTGGSQIHHHLSHSPPSQRRSSSQTSAPACTLPYLHRDPSIVIIWLRDAWPQWHCCQRFAQFCEWIHHCKPSIPSKIHVFRYINDRLWGRKKCRLPPHKKTQENSNTINNITTHAHARTHTHTYEQEQNLRTLTFKMDARFFLVSSFCCHRDHEIWPRSPKKARKRRVHWSLIYHHAKFERSQQTTDWLWKLNCWCKTVGNGTIVEHFGMI